MSDAWPVLRVVRGDPTPEELAVLTALASASGPDESVRRDQRGSWNDPAAQLRRPLYPRPGGWRASTHPT